MKKIIGLFTMACALFLAPLQSKADLAPSAWGTYHNSALAVTENTWSNPPYSNSELMLNMASALGQQNPDFAGISAADINNLINNPDFSSLIQNSKKSGQEATAYFRTVLDNKLNSGQMSQALHNVYITIFDANLPFDQIQQNLNAVNIAQFTAEEQNQFIAVKSIINNSNIFWTNWGNDHPAYLTKGQIGCLWDGVAGAIFFEAGPIGVLAAACVSASAMG